MKQNNIYVDTILIFSSDAIVLLFHRTFFVFCWLKIAHKSLIETQQPTQILHCANNHSELNDCISSAQSIVKIVKIYCKQLKAATLLLMHKTKGHYRKCTHNEI